MECKELETNMNGEAIATHADGCFHMWKEFLGGEIDQFGAEDADSGTCCHVIPMVAISCNPANCHGGSYGITADTDPWRVLPIFLM